MRILCRTQFDITATGVRGNHSRSRIPFQDKTGKNISTLDDWDRSRNKQRNWETINQIISLRTLPTNISEPKMSDSETQRFWSFEFELDSPSTVILDGQPLGAFYVDCRDVPMVTGLDETKPIHTCLDPGVNIHFSIIDK